MAIERWDPFREVVSLRDAMNSLLQESFVRPGASGGAVGGNVSALPLDVAETEDEYVVRASLPGVKPEDVDISVTGDSLTITGKTQDEKRDEQEGYLYQEIRRGTFTRTVALPADLKVEAASAQFENGMLTLTIPKAEQAKPRQIKINATGDGSSARPVGPGESGQQGQSNQASGDQSGSRG